MKRNIKFLRNAAIALLMMNAAAFMSCSENEEIVAVTDISVEPSTLTLLVGETHTLTVKTFPENANGKVAISWASNDTNVATVNAITGEVTAVDAGVAIIVGGLAGTGKTVSCIVTVEVPAENVTVEPATHELLVGAKYTLTATVLPDNATYKTVTWTSSAADIATVDAATGEVTAVGVGEATITASSGGKTGTCSLTVKPIPVESITIESEDFELEAGSTRTLTATVLPDNATYKTVTWTSSATNIATVDAATGEVTGIATGVAVITATAGDKSATRNVTVVPQNDIFLTVKPAGSGLVRIYTLAQHLVVNWGDGSSNEEYNSCTEISHTYADVSSTYSVKIMLTQGLTTFGDVLYNNNMTSDYVSPRMTGEIHFASFNDCPDLNVLAITNNKLTGLELKECPALLYLNCTTNKVTTLDVGNVTTLQYIFFNSNTLSAINMSGLSALKTLKLYSNSLTSLNVNDCTSLKYLDCGYNKITSLTLNSACKTTLTDLDCSYNELTSLDVSGFTALAYFTCRNNKLKTLDIRDCTGLAGTTYCLYNQLETVHVLGAIFEKLRLIDNQLTATELNRIFTDLHDRTGMGAGVLWIGSNPGTNDCDRSIATSKNYVFW
ncbi:MAG: Ig-like domain-containing protein [Prevotellaceae bacterium]|nr:Ig-like domain-containing protein [Prevotellaceae bacterium]